jgi:hypothetical protein
VLALIVLAVVLSLRATMMHMRLALIATAFALCATPTLFAQVPAPVQRPIFAGTWAPSEPARSDTLFDAGIGFVPGNGRLIIEQRPDRLTVTKQIPDDKLNPLLEIQGQFILTVAYRILEQPRGRTGGFGAAGDQRPSSWKGDRLVLVESRPDIRTITISFSLDGDRLRHETHVVVGPGQESTVTEWFNRVK